MRKIQIKEENEEERERERERKRERERVEGGVHVGNFIYFKKSQLSTPKSC